MKILKGIWRYFFITPDKLHKEIMNGNVDKIRSILDSDRDIGSHISNLPRFIKNLPLFMRTTSPEVIQLLLENGSEIEAHDDRGYDNLLRSAADFAENHKIVQLLIDNGAEIEARDIYGNTPLMRATSMSVTPEVVQLLIDNGAEIEARNNTGKTPLMEFFTPGVSRNIFTLLDMMKLLLDKGAEVNARDNDGNSPLMHAVRCGAPPWGPLELLIESGADIEAKNNEGMTPLMVAANCGGYGCQSPQNVQQLLYRGANPATKSNKGKRAIDFAEDNVKLVGTEAYQLLLEKSKE